MGDGHISDDGDRNWALLTADLTWFSLNARGNQPMDFGPHVPVYSC
jgi:hypothetical protein